MRKFPAEEERVETGPIQFGRDWPGIFLRGDDAGPFGFLLGEYLDDPSPRNLVVREQLRDFARLLRSCEVGE